MRRGWGVVGFRGGSMTIVQERSYLREGEGEGAGGRGEGNSGGGER